MDCRHFELFFHLIIIARMYASGGFRKFIEEIVVLLKREIKSLRARLWIQFSQVLLGCLIVIGRMVPCSFSVSRHNRMSSGQNYRKKVPSGFLADSRLTKLNEIWHSLHDGSTVGKKKKS